MFIFLVFLNMYLEENVCTNQTLNCSTAVLGEHFHHIMASRSQKQIHAGVCWMKTQCKYWVCSTNGWNEMNEKQIRKKKTKWKISSKELYQFYLFLCFSLCEFSFYQFKRKHFLEGSRSNGNIQ